MSLSTIYIGGFVGVLLSGAFLYIEIGNFATPQVPRTLFDERREIFSYTLGLFAGIPLAFFLLLLETSMTGGYFLSVVFELVVFVGLTELAQWLLMRSAYFGGGDERPFYALGFRAGISAILILAVVEAATGIPGVSPEVLALAAAQSLALLFISIAGALVSTRTGPGGGRPRGGPLPGAAFGTLGIILVAFGWFFGPYVGIAAAGLAIAGSLVVYLRLRAAILLRMRPPPAPRESMGASGPPPPRYGRVNE